MTASKAGGESPARPLWGVCLFLCSDDGTRWGTEASARSEEGERGQIGVFGLVLFVLTCLGQLWWHWGETEDRMLTYETAGALEPEKMGGAEGQD